MLKITNFSKNENAEPPTCLVSGSVFCRQTRGIFRKPEKRDPSFGRFKNKLLVSLLLSIVPVLFALKTDAHQSSGSDCFQEDC